MSPHPAGAEPPACVSCFPPIPRSPGHPWSNQPVRLERWQHCPLHFYVSQGLSPLGAVSEGDQRSKLHCGSIVPSPAPASRKPQALDGRSRFLRTETHVPGDTPCSDDPWSKCFKGLGTLLKAPWCRAPSGRKAQGSSPGPCPGQLQILRCLVGQCRHHPPRPARLLPKVRLG